MIRYYKLFDLLNRRGMKKSDLREILSPKTIAKLSKGQYISGEAIEKICLYLDCQPGDIMEVVEMEELMENSPTKKANQKAFLTEKEENTYNNDEPKKESYLETIPKGTNISEADAIGLTNRQPINI